MDYFFGIDVGTGSARAGLFDATGRLLTSVSKKTQMWRDGLRAEQSSENIWSCICECVKACLRDSGVAKEAIKGIGFDATCSLVVLDEAGRPLAVGEHDDAERNIIVWLDHRAIKEADELNANATQRVLRFVGGKISPEMQMPKLLWLKRHLPGLWKQAGFFFDLPDYLTFRATGSSSRSQCSVVCKWTYLGQEFDGDFVGWDTGFLESAGLGDLAENHFSRIGNEISPLGTAVGQGLSDSAASELGLLPGTPVGVSIIDAHAGGVGMMGIRLPQEETMDFDKRLALIGGTSSCHMAVSREARFIDGVWGPYASAMMPGLWLNEGGQSATGALIDHMIRSHAAFHALDEEQYEGGSIFRHLDRTLDKLAAEQGLSSPSLLTKELHICPYFHGNRSPRANPHLKGMVTGLTLSEDVSSLAIQYLATIQAIAYGTRHIIEAMNEKGYRIDTIFACGGGVKNGVFLQEHADITGCTIVVPEQPESVLLGSAILGACAANPSEGIEPIMQRMSRAGKTVTPIGGEIAQFHDRKYRIFHELYQDQLKYEQYMNS